MPINDDGTVTPVAPSDGENPWTDPFSIPVSKLPEYKNWFEEGMVTRPYDQGSCGGCWAFSAASTLESLAMISGTEPTGVL